MQQPNFTPTANLMLRETASQTAGPYVHIGLALAVAGLPERDEEIWNELAKDSASGERIEVVGRVIDGNGDLVRDALLEAWQADSSGHYQPAFDLKAPFNSFGRTATTAEGDSEWRFVTVKPGAIARPDGRTMAPHINLAIFARGVNIHLQTRLYFDDESEANADCPVLGAIESPSRRQTLIARREDSEGGLPRYRLDIVLQGEGETVFFDF
ncbi:protocatechuate 3,4-dioxygenase subunit alpha [Halomonas sp. DP8Y7-3]|uniref:protocatechuate 3,4-dioxygenase subunit alpha n=1 Tax=Halomonas sp. DP8Y7-3 TaxID=2859079 RepID=UPI001C93D488|nr:protocatechuate 3,4-dioxygenase subunit alpha [Halomonas sp. DP8Y7-3]MBY5930065.1 protocatechuate 3,4-dioxygenase subunit alpha [Halomonas sp. DP8Y7-3]